jgi:hypothetical protein
VGPATGCGTANAGGSADARGIAGGGGNDGVTPSGGGGGRDGGGNVIGVRRREGGGGGIDDCRGEEWSGRERSVGAPPTFVTSKEFGARSFATDSLISSSLDWM